MGYHHYYHCYKGCLVRLRSQVVHDAFAEELKLWKPTQGVAVLYKYIVKQLLQNGGESRHKETKKLREELAEIEAY